MAFKLGSVCEGVTAQGAAEVVLVLLMAVLNVFFQRGKALVASITIWASEQLGKRIWCSCGGRDTVTESTHGIRPLTTGSLGHTHPTAVLLWLHLPPKMEGWMSPLCMHEKSVTIDTD